MNFFYRFIIGINNQVNKFLALNKYIKIKIKEKSLVFNWLLIEIMLLITASIFIYGIGSLGLGIDILLGLLTLVSIFLALAFLGLLIRDSNPGQKSNSKSIEHYFNKYNIAIEHKKNQNSNLTQENDIGKSTIFKNLKLDSKVSQILNRNKVLSMIDKKWNGLGENYGTKGSQLIALIIFLKENGFLLSGVSNKVILDFFQAKINNIKLPKEQHISQVREKIFTDNELDPDLKYYDTYMKFNELISTKSMN